MSESEKRKPISVYLTPKAAVALRKYNMGSGYASVSRTVEEIILAFDAVYMNMQTFTQFTQTSLRADLSNDKKAEYFLLLLTTLLNIGNALSRLQPETVDLQ
jgi:hypothetical protein